ncbi:MAG: enoyl-CoA hydratase [Alteromonadaceae bacterium]|nr:enoyl-CoA hydratase [Alteromonadaceae bacterium]
MIRLPPCKTLLLEQQDLALFVTLNRPQRRNAMSLAMVSELAEVFAAIAGDTSIRAVVLRGAEGHFCAGADIQDMIAARSGQAGEPGEEKGGSRDPFYKLNRTFGYLLVQVENAPQVVITVLEGAVLGGGMGLACVSDVGLCTPDARLGLPETGLGIPPAQIAPFMVKRIGLTETRRLALLGLRFDGPEAVRLGIAHELVEPEVIPMRLKDILDQVRGSAPEANRITKALLHRVHNEPLEDLLDDAAEQFARAVRGQEGEEGTLAFIQKRKPYWAANEGAEKRATASRPVEDRE